MATQALSANHSGYSLHDIISLQLKKPKSWNWELSTSKSSPHIVLPTIKLYDSRGKLLVEAKNNDVQRRSWHSSDIKSVSYINDNNNSINKTERDSFNSKGLRKSKSDVFYRQKVDDRNSSEIIKSKGGFYPLQKSNSDMVRKLGSKNVLRKSRSIRDLSYMQKCSKNDVFQALTKHNEESAKRAILDGYREFITPQKTLYEEESDVEENSKKHKPIKELCDYSESSNSVLKPEINSLTHKRYRTRTCSAGTLVVCEDSFKNYRRRRRNVLKEEQCNYGSVIEENNNTVQMTKTSEPKKRASRVEHRSVINNDIGPHESSMKLDEKGYISKPKHEHVKSDAVASRRLISDHDKMGANVSRHSSKGLHGRRSQSSGSICNSKGRHGSSGDTKMCGSLPSYLDDRNSHTCNNNHHDCEKAQLDGVDRIPPIGDAAPLHWKFSDTQTVLQCDQGYGSERSPEEEYPPSLHDGACHYHMDSHTCYPFITPESTFSVTLLKGSRGLGLSVSGGTDSGNSWPGLIRIKRLFPHQPAATCGLLNVGDLLLEVNGITLTGLTNYEALEVLRTSPSQVELTVSRPPPDVLSCVSPISEVPPPPPRREPPNTLNLTPPPYQPTPEDDLYHGEFEITLTKINFSLGFTLRKEDDSALGHYVRALVREPALSDGRIHAGDKIISVNGVEILSMSHEQAVQYLRQAGDVVTLRLYRDPAQTPVSTLSPSEMTPRASLTRKPNLRPEALDMLNDIAMRKIGNPDMYTHSASPNVSPRRLRRQPYSSESSQTTDNSNKYLMTDEQFHEGLFKKPSLPLEDEADIYNSLFSVDSDDCDRPSRPSSLDLCNSKGTPVITRKPKFNFSLAHNAYELNNLDPEILDAPNLTYNLGKDEVKSAEMESSNSYPQEPVSMPHIPSDSSEFSYKNPAYQSAHPPCGNENVATKTIDENSMKKWKGVVFNADEEEKTRVENECMIFSIELNRGWNSRLGFSLQGAAGVTYVSAVHADSVAAKDGRLKPGDHLIKVNDESVENMSTGEIIDLLRIVRGPVCIVVARYKSNQDCMYKKQC
ncbi:hypothetical protein RN001_004194 [Aquatica leii]|uniref:PDZ domain-containing protein n=1 Tax=Aquatica leii TaxID=1421715 RepID=A0AAN7SRL1_9COLE|nr:hypothetical protein RN001_004194 [Aquatica leii]